MTGDLGAFLAEGGAVVGGGAALGAALGYVAGAVAHELGLAVDHEAWARKCGAFGGVLGLYALVVRAVE